ncbi:hypothetical protein, partial [Umezawaea beigongshangensis]|uniref:hypothetical protein n=1 Tax=Umezawaea beigongshangensis TaxID=2780383 RepID=UPI0018F12CEE
MCGALLWGVLVGVSVRGGVAVLVDAAVVSPRAGPAEGADADGEPPPPVDDGPAEGALELGAEPPGSERGAGAGLFCCAGALCDGTGSASGCLVRGAVSGVPGLVPGSAVGVLADDVVPASGDGPSGAELRGEELPAEGLLDGEPDDGELGDGELSGDELLDGEELSGDELLDGEELSGDEEDGSLELDESGVESPPSEPEPPPEPPPGPEGASTPPPPPPRCTNPPGLTFLVEITSRPVT